jgi:hypothetical protein
MRVEGTVAGADIHSVDRPLVPHAGGVDGCEVFGRAALGGKPPEDRDELVAGVEQLIETLATRARGPGTSLEEEANGPGRRTVRTASAD